MPARSAKRKPWEHKDINSRGGTRAWSRMVARVCREEPLCWLRLDGCTIVSTTADHVIPKKIRPDLAMHRPNLRGACRSCNQRKGDKPLSRVAQLRRQQMPARALEFFQGRKTEKL